MIILTITLYWQVIGAVVAALLIFSWAFNHWITEHERKHGYTTGKTARLVIIGVLGTLTLTALVCWQAAVLCLIAFAISGPQMVLGESDRELARAQRLAEQRSRRESELLERERIAAMEKTRE